VTKLEKASKSLSFAFTTARLLGAFLAGMPGLGLPPETQKEKHEGDACFTSISTLPPPLFLKY
jgi:hypothetical protein